MDAYNKYRFKKAGRVKNSLETGIKPGTAAYFIVALPLNHFGQHLVLQFFTNVLNTDVLYVYVCILILYKI